MYYPYLIENYDLRPVLNSTSIRNTAAVTLCIMEKESIMQVDFRLLVISIKINDFIKILICFIIICNAINT